MRARSETPDESVRRLLDVVLQRPGDVATLSTGDLDLLLRIARRVRLLGRLAVDLQVAGVDEALPVVARDQLQSFLVMADSRARLAGWELDRIAWALRDERSVPLVLMKGCAYIALALPNARGRFFADVDILLPESELERIESVLNRCGWRTRKLTPYDQNYYRRWTHELPPLTHIERQVEIDLHHNVLARTARLKPQSIELLKTVQQIENSPFSAMADEDIVLHTMTHLMFDSDLADKLRDLLDIDDLLRHFAAAKASFWNDLIARANTLNLQRPAYYGLRYARKLLDCPVPHTVFARTKKWSPPAPIVWLMDRLVPRALYPPHPDFPSRLTNFSRLLLYIRSHWIRMPPWLLAYHLIYKFLTTRGRTSGSGT